MFIFHPIMTLFLTRHQCNFAMYALIFLILSVIHNFEFLPRLKILLFCYLKRVFHTHFLGTFIIYQHNKFHISRPNQ